LTGITSDPVLKQSYACLLFNNLRQSISRILSRNRILHHNMTVWNKFLTYEYVTLKTKYWDRARYIYHENHTLQHYPKYTVNPQYILHSIYFTNLLCPVSCLYLYWLQLGVLTLLFQVKGLRDKEKRRFTKTELQY
jgi:hypothetical protein